MSTPLQRREALYALARLVADDIRRERDANLITPPMYVEINGMRTNLRAVVEPSLAACLREPSRFTLYRGVECEGLDSVVHRDVPLASTLHVRVVDHGTTVYDRHVDVAWSAAYACFTPHSITLGGCYERQFRLELCAYSSFEHPSIYTVEDAVALERDDDDAPLSDIQ